MVEDGATQMDGGDLPVNMSGGVLSTNPIGASGMIRFGEAAMQVRGQAGEHQVDGARLAVGHAYGGASLGEMVQYVDVSEWVNELLQAEEGEEGRADVALTYAPFESGSLVVIASDGTTQTDVPSPRRV